MLTNLLGVKYRKPVTHSAYDNGYLRKLYKLVSKPFDLIYYDILSLRSFS